MEGEPSSLGSNSGGSPSGGSNPNPGGGPSGGSDTLLPDNDSPEKRKRREMADYLEGLLNEEIQKRGGDMPRFANTKVSFSDLDISLKVKSTKSLIATDTEKYLIEYRRDYPDAFIKKNPTLISSVISHLRNNNN